MAGKENLKKTFSSPLLKPQEMEEDDDSPEPTVCWRKQVDDKLKRLHSLLFGVDNFLQKNNFSSAHLLGLRLLGFLESHSQSEADEVLTRPIRREVLSNLDMARRALVPDSDRYVIRLL